MNIFDKGSAHGAKTLLELVPALGEKPVCEIDLNFPHLAERILLLWGSSECVDYLEELLNYVPTSERPTLRQGFPFAVMTELSVIQNYHVAQFAELDSRRKRRKDNPWK